jgi:2-methylcitrate dehydratase PrpD
VDSIQEAIAGFACGLHYDDLPAGVVHAAKGLVIDTLGVLMAGFPYEPCRAL